MMKMTPTIDKVCMVCGDKALGYNFNAVTCESCKAFFRRNALSSKAFTCPFNETCEINVVTRRFCQRCRLEKCFQIGMRKEYIMSEADKMLKKRKIEMNRAKRKSKLPSADVNGSEGDVDVIAKKIKTEQPVNDDYCTSQDASSETGYTDSSQCCSSNDNVCSPHVTVMSPISPVMVRNSSDVIHPVHDAMSPAREPIRVSNGLFDGNSNISSTTSDNIGAQQSVGYPTKESSTDEIVDFMVEHPNDAGQYLNTLMPTQKDAMEVVARIINSQKDAIRFMSHLIGWPGDALKIISRIMDSPFEALSVFTKLSSPNDSLEIIAKCVNSPKDVLQFVQQLMQSPKNAVDTVNKFLNSPAEAMRMLNDLVNSSMADSTTTTSEPTDLSTTSCYKAPSIGGNNDDITIPPPLTPQTNHVPPTQDEHEEENAFEALISNAIHIEYNSHNLDRTNRGLNDAETAKLNELIVAYKALSVPLDEDISLLSANRHCSQKLEKNPQDPQLITLINLTAEAIKRLIKMVKKITAFRNMCQEDQVALLKGGCTEMMILRSIMQYDFDNSIWNIPHIGHPMSSIKSDVLKLANNNAYEEYENFIRSFDVRLRKDENIILIMSAIVLFTPNRPKTVHTDVLALEQNAYYYLLRRYLESIYAGCEAKSLFLKLIQKIDDLQRLKDVIIAVYLDVNPHQVQPLLREIFDIKS